VGSKISHSSSSVGNGGGVWTDRVVVGTTDVVVVSVALVGLHFSGSPVTVTSTVRVPSTTVEHGTAPQDT
jgi:hypothetical protein